MEGIRINKFLSDRGVCSRREADRLILEGRVLVDGSAAVMGQKVTGRETIAVDGVTVKNKEKTVLIAFYKPKGIVCTTSSKEPDNIVDFINYPTRIFPIGRLDKDSEGLILLTNRGELSDKILRGSNYHEKEYIVHVNRKITEGFLKKMSEGVEILDTVTRPCQVEKINNYTFRIILTQGLNRQIRRMCEALGCRVERLKRIRVMNIRIDGLERGKYRDVTKSERKELEVLLEVKQKWNPEIKKEKAVKKKSVKK